MLEWCQSTLNSGSVFCSAGDAKWGHRMAAVICIITVITAGCSGIIDGNDSTSTDPPLNVTSSPEATQENIRTSRPTDVPIDTPTEKEREYLASGKEVTRVVGGRLEKIHEMKAVSRNIYRNNTIYLTVRLNKGDPLYMGMMNVTQTVSVVLQARTTPNASRGFQNGVNGVVHRPKNIYIDIQDPRGRYLGSFEIHPESAAEYRLGMFDTNVFARNTERTLDLERDWERGIHSPGWYLNRSQLVDWARAYKIILRNETDPSKTVYDQEFPIENVSVRPSEMRVHHDLYWDDDEMGQIGLSAQSDINKAYWMTTDRAWAMAPLTLSHRLNRPGLENVSGHMDLENVYWLLERPKNNTNHSWYYSQIEKGIAD